MRDITDKTVNVINMHERFIMGKTINRSNAAKKAVETRKKNSVAQKRSEAAKKAAATRKANALAKKRSEAARKAWVTRRASTPN